MLNSLFASASPNTPPAFTPAFFVLLAIMFAAFLAYRFALPRLSAKAHSARYKMHRGR